MYAFCNKIRTNLVSPVKLCFLRVPSVGHGLFLRRLLLSIRRILKKKL